MKILKAYQEVNLSARNVEIDLSKSVQPVAVSSTVPQLARRWTGSSTRFPVTKRNQIRSDFCILYVHYTYIINHALI